MEKCQMPVKCQHNSNLREANEIGGGEHFCVGVCGEECINICKECDLEKWAEITTIYFGHEDEPNAMFIQLKECGHIIEVITKFSNTVVS